MKNIDRITEAYNGVLGNGMMAKNRERIHWVCSQAKGETILDVGCSQGIASIILAREGKKVQGIDICQESIDFANNVLTEEDVATRKHVLFTCVDFMTYCDGLDTKFDSIIMSELFEHLADPERFAKRACELLKDDGRIIVTTPFGINDYHDHKRTYYTTELYGLLSSRFNVADVAFFTGHIGMTGVKAKDDTRCMLNEELFGRSEKAFYSHERSLLNQATHWEQKSAQWKKTAEDNLKLIEEWKVKTKEQQGLVAGIQREKDQANAKLAATQREKDQAEAKLAATQSEKDQAEAKLAATQSEKDQAEAKLAALQREYAALSSSKLGKIQTYIWRKRTAKKLKKKDKIFGFLRRTAKKSPQLVYIVRKFRGQNVSMSDTKSEASLISEKKATISDVSFDLDYLKRIEKRINEIPLSNAGRYYQKYPQKLAIISDEFLFNAFKDVAECIALHPRFWKEQISGTNILLIISGWKGIESEWRGFAIEGSGIRRVIYEIIEHCKANGVPTLFYSIEDPPNYDRFIGIAQKCDYVFTTAAEIVSCYKDDCGHDRVYPLMFGINPLYHNPVGSMSDSKMKEVVFSGSWMDKYPERGKDICTIFDGVLASNRGLKIIDRNFSIDDDQYKFPAEYAPYISPAVSHENLQKIHKLYDFAINMNSVKTSQTMFANRASELMAVGNLVLSNYSVGINSHFPIIYTVQDKEEVTNILNTLNESEARERQAIGIRHVMTGHTYFDRYADIIDAIGIAPLHQNRVVAVVVDEVADDIRAQFDRQTYKDKVFCSKDDLIGRYDDFDIIAFFGRGMEYGSFYLEDMVNGFKFTDCDYITKDAYCIGNVLKEGRQHDFVSWQASKYRTLYWAKSFDAHHLLDLPDEYIELPNGYSIDCLQYNAKPSSNIRQVRTYKLSVVVPVYNNGLHLYGKAFGSLMRSSMFNDMEIILVDDGSTDESTKHYVQFIEQRYDNVVTFFFEEGGSGSASRSRNKGVELASADYLTFLDPDNEAIGDGYAKLYDIALAEGHDLVVGNMIRFREHRYLVNYYHYFKEYYGSESVEGDKSDFIKKISFTPMSIQAMVIKKSLITNSGIEQVVGAVGQDSFFSWQLMANAKQIRAINKPIHIYYAVRLDSTVNTVGASFFYKNLLLEREQFQWLKQEGLLHDYMDIRFNNFFKEWLLGKLELCREEEKKDCIKFVSDIFLLYRDFYNRKDSTINAWRKAHEL